MLLLSALGHRDVCCAIDFWLLLRGGRQLGCRAGPAMWHICGVGWACIRLLHIFLGAARSSTLHVSCQSSQGRRCRQRERYKDSAPPVERCQLTGGEAPGEFLTFHHPSEQLSLHSSILLGCCLGCFWQGSTSCPAPPCEHLASIVTCQLGQTCSKLWHPLLLVLRKFLWAAMCTVLPVPLRQPIHASSGLNTSQMCWVCL